MQSFPNTYDEHLVVGRARRSAHCSSGRRFVGTVGGPASRPAILSEARVVTVFITIAPNMLERE